jgi:hypothetical protein
MHCSGPAGRSRQPLHVSPDRHGCALGESRALETDRPLAIMPAPVADDGPAACGPGRMRDRAVHASEPCRPVGAHKTVAVLQGGAPRRML